MAHKTLVNGTAYEISGGKTLVDGTAYSIKNGKTLVGGTVYEVGFGLPMVVVTVIGDAISSNYCETYASYSTPDGNTGGLNTAGAYELPIGTIICCNVAPDYYSDTRPSGYIYLNDECIDGGDKGAYYEFTLTTNITIEYVDRYYRGGEIYITEE